MNDKGEYIYIYIHSLRDMEHYYNGGKDVYICVIVGGQSLKLVKSWQYL